MCRLTQKKKEKRSGCFHAALHLTFKLKMNKKGETREILIISHPSNRWHPTKKLKKIQQQRVKFEYYWPHRVSYAVMLNIDCITFKREYRQKFLKKYACEKKLESRQEKNVDNSQVDRLKSLLQLISLDGFFFWSVVGQL